MDHKQSRSVTNQVDHGIAVLNSLKWANHVFTPTGEAKRSAVSAQWNRVKVF